MSQKLLSATPSTEETLRLANRCSQLLSLFGGHMTAQLPRMVRLRQLATLELEGPGGGDDRSVKIKSLEAAKIMKMKWLVLFCIEADFCE